MLCTKCRGKMFIRNIGHCSACGGMTNSGMFKLCVSCSQSKDQCQACLAPLSPPATSNGGNGATVGGTHGTSASGDGTA